MQFSRELTWKAVEVILPHLKTLKENNIHTNLTDALKDAAVELFLAHNDSTDKRGDMDWGYSEFIVARALLELKENGWITFGEQKQFWA